MTGIILALFVALMRAGGELVGKISTSKERKNTISEYSLAFGGRVMGAILVFPLVFFIPIVDLSLSYTIILFCSTILNAIATVTALKAVKYGDLSLVGPLSAFTIPLLLITGYVIGGEVPNLIGIIGVITIFLGTYSLQISEIKKGWIGPIHAIYNNKGARYMLITAFIWSLTTPLDKLGIVEYGVFTWMLYLNVSIAIIMTVYSLCMQRSSFIDIIQIPAVKKITLMTGVGGIALLVQMFAIQLTLAIYVISIKRASGIFSIFLGYFFFQEKNIGSKLLATGIMIVGVILISVFGNI